MIGLIQQSVEHWKSAKTNGWKLDATTLRHMRDDIQKDLDEHRRVTSTLTPAQLIESEWDAKFGQSEREAELALAEIILELEAKIS